MNVIIAGCGRVGTLLSTRLALEGHDVSVIDRDRVALGRLGAGFTGAAVLGDAFDRDALEAAGIRQADAFCAVTSGDNSNIISAKVAREVYGVPRVVARIYDPRRAEIYRRFGIAAVSSVTWSVNEVASLILHPHIRQERSFGDGEVRLVAIEVPPHLDARPTDLLVRPGAIAVTSIVSSGTALLPTAGTLLAAGDLVYITAAADALHELELMLHP